MVFTEMISARRRKKTKKAENTHTKKRRWRRSGMVRIISLPLPTLLCPKAINIVNQRDAWRKIKNQKNELEEKLEKIHFHHPKKHENPRHA